MESSTSHNINFIMNSSGSTFVEPAEPLNSRTVACSAIENICAQVHHTLALFFSIDEDSDALIHFEYFRQGLSRALCHSDLWAGTLQKDARGAFSIHVPKAPNAGVRFHYRDVSRDHTFPSFADFKKAGFPYADGNLDGLSQLRPEDFPVSESDNPTFVTQLTHIKGGLVLSSSFSHLVSDVIRARDFLVEWANQTKLASEGVMSLPAPFPSSISDTSRLSPTPTGPSDFESLQEKAKDLPNFKVMDINDPVGTVSELQSFQPKAHIGPCSEQQEDFLREPISGAWRVLRSDAEAIADFARKSGGRLTYMNVLISFLWSRLFVAKYPNAETQPNETTILNAINIRNRLSPPLPHNYQGAAVDLLRATVPSKFMGAIVSASGDESNKLAEVAIALREANGEWSEKQFMTLLEVIQQTPISPGVIPRGPIDFLVTDHRGFQPLVEASWGPSLGQCEAFREPYIGRAIPTGEIELMPGPKGEIHVLISAERVVLERLSSDTEMRRFSRRLFLAHDFVKSTQKAGRMSARL
ncbi:Hypothetical protein R9X50_00098200 [Acrodontium crateriforme]|uniref:Trichothecene 3-O-acetyltransferase n=1 Tax=Acrodontium crateriforme TaxID=150365 RepID=A0AAQ3M1K1_9PEZI|nr:Hypothetical protein R9X50_00098200 [Acrodontium crateriforme]